MRSQTLSTDSTRGFGHEAQLPKAFDVGLERQSQSRSLSSFYCPRPCASSTDSLLCYPSLFPLCNTSSGFPSFATSRSVSPSMRVVYTSPDISSVSCAPPSCSPHLFVEVSLPLVIPIGSQWWKICKHIIMRRSGGHICNIAKVLARVARQLLVQME